MRLKGICTIEWLELGEKVKTYTQENLIPDNTWVAVLSWDGSGSVGTFVGNTGLRMGSLNISISQDTRDPVASVYLIDDVISTGRVANGITSPVWVDEVDPPFGTVINLIDDIGTQRTFNSVALTALNPGNVQDVDQVIAYAWLKLDIPCTQEIGQTLRLNYSIQFLDEIGDGLINNRTARYDFGASQFDLSRRGFRMSYLCASPCNLPVDMSQVIKLPYSGVLIAALFQNPGFSDYQVGWDSTEKKDEFFKWKYLLSKGRQDFIGIIFNSLLQGVSNDEKECYSISKFEYLEQPFQTGFWHSSSSEKPFYDNINFGESTGRILLSGNWENRLPELYKIIITQSGDAATAKYKFSKLSHIGLDGNAFKSLSSDSFYRNKHFKHTNNLHGWREEDFDVHSFKNSKIVQFDATGITLIDLITGEFTTWDASSTTQLPVTSLRQIAIDKSNSLIYAACRATGLWIINVINNSTYRAIANPCYGVDVGNNSIAYAISNGLFSSANWTLPLTFSHPLSSDWSRTKFLKSDSVNAGKLGIVAEINSGTNRIIWHDTVTNITVDGYEESGVTEVRSTPACFDCSEEGSNWYFYYGGIGFAPVIRKILFGNVSREEDFNAFEGRINHSIYGDNNYCKITTFKDSVFAFEGLRGGNFTLNYGNPGAITFIINLQSGLCFNSSSSLFNILNDSSAIWEDYGWNGTNWVLENTGDKLCHTANQPLINGLQIKFENGTSTPHFLQGENFCTSVNYGLLKDNATEDFEIQTQWYSKGIYKDVLNLTIPSTTFNLPATSDIYFRKIDIDTPEIHDFIIDGTAVTDVFVDGTVPTQGEISIDFTGVVQVAAADVGKILTGFYYWISV